MHHPDPDAVAAKRALRQEALALRRALTGPARAAADDALLTRLVTTLDQEDLGQEDLGPEDLGPEDLGQQDLGPGSRTVAAYVPVGTEPGGPGLPDVLRAAGFAVLLPVLEPDGDLDWALHTGELLPGPRGLLQPAGPRRGHDAIRDAAAVIVPAVAVDRRGVRLGRGGGSYDRALARLRPRTPVLALLYDGELTITLPEEAHDRRVGTVVTPSRVHRAGTG
jgi:5-formyltetrahydrofolate cyclo-ligase